ncbi:MAG: ferrochelatase [Planctomycetes bacterium]|nr:ferrochelatase [Planctomycetota bacterium]
MPRPGSRRGVLLVNLGTPDAPETREVRRYLREFLSDPRVLDMSALGRWLLLNLVILPRRPKVSAEAYRKIWTDDGSPLLVQGRALARFVQTALGPDVPVVLAMRYGNPSIAAGLDDLRGRGVDRVCVFPLYPHYSSASTGSTLELVYRLAGERWNTPFLDVVPPFFDHPGMIAAFAAIGRKVIDDLRPDHVLFSFHGLPERQIRKSDESGAHCLASAGCCDRIVDANRNCYRAQCFATARGIAGGLELEATRWSVSFQSRLGRTPWIQPFTDVVIPELAAKGVRRVAVFSPAFVADCLETLEEIGIRAREQFHTAGGEDLRLVPSLNTHALWVKTVIDLIRLNGGGV